MSSLIPPMITYTANAGSLFFLGGGLCYILEEKKYTHIPLFVLFPEAYCAYNIFKHRNTTIDIFKPA